MAGTQIGEFSFKLEVKYLVRRAPVSKSGRAIFSSTLRRVFIRYVNSYHPKDGHGLILSCFDFRNQ